jgi:hypothetical protein
MKSVCPRDCLLPHLPFHSRKQPMSNHAIEVLASTSRKRSMVAPPCLAAVRATAAPPSRSISTSPGRSTGRSSSCAKQISTWLAARQPPRGRDRPPHQLRGGGPRCHRAQGGQCVAVLARAEQARQRGGGCHPQPGDQQATAHPGKRLLQDLELLVWETSGGGSVALEQVAALDGEGEVVVRRQ